MVSPESSISGMTKCYVLATGAALQIQPNTRPSMSFWLKSGDMNRNAFLKTEFAISAPTLSAINVTSTTQPRCTARSAVSGCRSTTGGGRERTERGEREGQTATHICKTTASTECQRWSVQLWLDILCDYSIQIQFCIFAWLDLTPVHSRYRTSFLKLALFMTIKGTFKVPSLILSRKSSWISWADSHFGNVSR